MHKLHIATLRSRNHWTQEEVAKKIGVTKGYYCNIENSRKKPSFNLIIKLQNIFGENIEVLLMDENKINS